MSHLFFARWAREDSNLSLLKIRFGSIESQAARDPILRGSTLIAMMQATNRREGNNVIARAG